MLPYQKYPANYHHRFQYNKLPIGKAAIEYCSTSIYFSPFWLKCRVVLSHRTGKPPPPLLRGQPAPSRSSIHAPPPGMLLPPTAGRSSTSSTGIPPNMVIPQPPHPRGRPPSATPNVTNYHPPADRTERSTKDPTPTPAHQVSKVQHYVSIIVPLPMNTVET